MAKGSQEPCPICSLVDQRVLRDDYGERLNVDCRRCGRFRLTQDLNLSDLSVTLRLSAWIRDVQERGSGSLVDLNAKALADITTNLPYYRVAEKQLLLMRAIERRTSFPGGLVDLDSELDFPLAWARGAGEFRFLLSSLVDRHLLRNAGDTEQRICQIQITSAGWDYLDEHRRDSPLSEQAFVAMSFSKGLLPVWTDAIKPTLHRTGWRPLRVDSEQHIDRIDARIITEIKDSRFVVADVTDHRAGVYFEAGYALGLGLPVIWSVHERDLERVHFDTRQYNHIVWTHAADLAEQLEHRVLAVLGRGPGKAPR